MRDANTLIALTHWKEGRRSKMTIRRLAAILAADVVGFSSMMERNEEGTLARLLALPAPLPPRGRARALSEPGVVPSGYVSGDAAREACAATGKRLCREAEWVTACRGERQTNFPYGTSYRQGACNVFREDHPARLLHGSASAKAMNDTRDLPTALAASAPPNPHLKYSDANSQGYGIALITGTQVVATLTTIERPVTNAAAAVKRTASFVVPKDRPGDMQGPVLIGTKPFPFT